MIGNLTYRRKLQLFIIGSIILLLLAYLFGFRKSYNASRELRSVKEQAEVVKSAETLKTGLEARLNSIDIRLGNLKVVEDDQEFILTTINQSNVKNRIRIIEIMGTDTHAENDISISIYGATVEGAYMDLVNLLRTFEESGHDGNIVSASFYRYSDNKTKSTSTRMKFYLQEIKAL
jgi:hypothetical protein